MCLTVRTENTQLLVYYYGSKFRSLNINRITKTRPLFPQHEHRQEDLNLVLKNAVSACHVPCSSVVWMIWSTCRYLLPLPYKQNNNAGVCVGLPTMGMRCGVSAITAGKIQTKCQVSSGSQPNVISKQYTEE